MELRWKRKEANKREKKLMNSEAKVDKEREKEWEQRGTWEIETESETIHSGCLKNNLSNI